MISFLLKKKVINTCFCMKSLYRNCICIVLLGMVYKLIVITHTPLKNKSIKFYKKKLVMNSISTCIKIIIFIFKKLFLISIHQNDKKISKKY